MNARQENYLSIYCGMGPERLGVLLDISTGKKVFGASRKHFNSAGVVDSKGFITLFGYDLLARAMSILDGTFAPDTANFAQVDLDRIEPARMARLEWIKSNGLRTTHIKLLRSLALYPGAVYYHFVSGYGHENLGWLIDEKWVNSSRRETLGSNLTYARLYLSIKALRALRMMIKACAVPKPDPRPAPPQPGQCI